MPNLEIAEDAEVIVVGAGPAGSACAAILAERGHDVLLVDQSSFPRDKPCGDGLTRSAVGFLERMGLEELIAVSQPIEGLRMVIDHDSIDYRRYLPTPRGPHYARCIPRGILDKALLDSAVDRGARFLEARVIDRVGPEGGLGVRAQIGSRDCVLHARHVIAADGATSRLRRVSGHSRQADPLAAYAVRAYYRCEPTPEPVFDTYLPLELRGTRIAGYGWVFPIDEHTVNVGVGYWRGAGISSPPKIREVLSEFVEYLNHRTGSRFGELEQVSKLAGSPLGVEFRRDRCEMDGVVFVGDAARTTDPWTGEGIAYALHGAEKIAELVSARAHGRNGHVDAGALLGRRFGRLRQDLSFPLRVLERRLNHSGRSLAGMAQHPFLRTLKHVIAAPEREPSLIDTPAGGLLGSDAEMCIRLHKVNDILLDELETGFPFAAELLHSEKRAGLGPISAVVAILAADGVESDEALLAGASALELIRASSRPIRETVNLVQSRGARLNNAFCVLITDFALSRGVHQAGRVGAWFTSELSAVMKNIYSGQFLESRQLFDQGRSVEDYVASAQARMSGPLALAGRLSAIEAGHPPETAVALSRFGWELGVAVQICEDLEDLFDGDESVGREPGADLLLGAHPLPVLFAIREDPALGEMLSEPIEPVEVEGVIERVVATDALAQTLLVADAWVQKATAALDELEGCVPERLHELATLVLGRTHTLVAAPPRALLKLEPLESTAPTRPASSSRGEDRVGNAPPVTRARLA